MQAKARQLAMLLLLLDVADANVAAELRAAAATGVQWAQDVVVSQGLCHNSAIAPFSRTIKVPGYTERKTRHSPAGLLCHTPSPPPPLSATRIANLK